jgi:hypothetical protein
MVLFLAVAISRTFIKSSGRLTPTCGKVEKKKGIRFHLEPTSHLPENTQLGSSSSGTRRKSGSIRGADLMIPTGRPDRGIQICPGAIGAMVIDD